MSKFKIIIPAFNEERHIGNVIRSLLEYGIDSNDIVVVNGGSSDNTLSASESLNVKVYTSAIKLNPAEARNKGASITESDYLVFLDADVLVTSSWVSALHEIVCSRKEGVWGETYHLSTAPSFVEIFWFANLPAKRYINGGNIIIDRSTFKRLRGFDETLETGEDVDLCQRAETLNVKLVFCKKMIVHHEGYPKSIADFIRRERWHGKGDLASWNRAIKSPVTLASALFVMLHFLILVLAPLSLAVSFLTAILLVSLCAVITASKFPFDASNFIQTSALTYFYLLGRSASLLDRLRACFS